MQGVKLGKWKIRSETTPGRERGPARKDTESRNWVGVDVWVPAIFSLFLGIIWHACTSAAGSFLQISCAMHHHVQPLIICKLLKSKSCSGRLASNSARHAAKNGVWSVSYLKGAGLRRKFSLQHTKTILENLQVCMLEVLDVQVH